MRFTTIVATLILVFYASGALRSANAQTCTFGNPCDPSTLSVSGTSTLSGNVTATAGANNLSAYNVSSVLYVDGVQYSGIVAAVNACMNPGGCTIFDAQNETLAANAFPTASYPVHIYASGTWTVNGTQTIPATTVISGVGHPGSLGNSWNIVAGGMFPSNYPLIQLGSSTGDSPGVRLENVTFNCNSVTGSYAVVANWLSEDSGLNYFAVINCPGSTAYSGVIAPVIDVNGGGNQFFSIENGDMQPGSGSTGGCIYIHGQTRPAKIGPLTCNSGSGTQGDGVLIDNSFGGIYLNIHGEHLANVVHLGYSVGSGAQDQTIIGASGATTVTNSTVTIDNSATTNYWILNAESVGGNCAIKDNPHFSGLSFCDEADSVFVQETGTGTTYFTGSPNFGLKSPLIGVQGIYSAIKTVSSNYELTTSDAWLNASGSVTIKIPTSANPGQDWSIVNVGSGTVTLACDGGTLYGASSSLAAGTGVKAATDGSNCIAF